MKLWWGRALSPFTTTKLLPKTRLYKKKKKLAMCLRSMVWKKLARNLQESRRIQQIGVAALNRLIPPCWLCCTDKRTRSALWRKHFICILLLTGIPALGCCNRLADLQLCTGGCALRLVFSSGSKCGLEPCCFPFRGMCCFYCGGDAVSPQGCK